ncbi:MAG: hypothetical protein HZA50_11790 [Planctomycetes bacterium]|nr:hypothetical protein [Planctomycetota bacterium]
MEQLIGEKEVCLRLGISHRTFLRYRPRMIARGLRQIRGDRRILYRSSDLDRFINRASETGILVAPPKKEGELSCQK